MDLQRSFVNQAVNILRGDSLVLGLTVGGSWITGELDEYSDVDFILVTHNNITDNKALMWSYAQRLGHLLSAFTGEHVGDKRVLICMYELSGALLHVDIKFLTLPEFHHRVEDPVILLDTDGQLAQVIATTSSAFPPPDLQWMEDRFWTWVHYSYTKIQRGEYFEAFDTAGFLRAVVLGPMLHLKHGNQPRRVRRVETLLPPEDLSQLKRTLPQYDKASLLDSLRQMVALYQNLRTDLFDERIICRPALETQVLQLLYPSS